MPGDKKVVIIGTGPGGYVSAIRAAQLGIDVTVIEKDSVGGVCLNAGCIPTKALLSSVDVLVHIQTAEKFGISVKEIVPEFSKMVARKDRIVSQLRKGVEFLFKKNGITLVNGKVLNISSDRVELPPHPYPLSQGERGQKRNSYTIKLVRESGVEEELSVQNIIIAAGSLPLKPAVFQFDGEKVITSTEALQMKEVPEKLLIVGGGAIGLEFAYMFSALGSEVSIIEEMAQLLPGEDSEIANLLKENLKKQGINIHTEVRVDSIEVNGGNVNARLSSGNTLEADKVLIAIGRVPNTKGIGLEEMNLLDEKGFIKVNKKMETAVPGIYAIGDAAGGMLLAHKASFEGIAAAENIAGLDSEMGYGVIPRCIFTKPEAAAVGISEESAKKSGRENKVGKFPFSALGKAWAINDTEGMVKIITDASSEEILGIYIIGPGASDLIGEAALAIKLEATAEIIAGTIHAHPTLTEAIMEASHSVLGKAIHI